MNKISLLAPYKLAVLKKEYVARIASQFFDVYLINEYPKSGGTWLKYMLAEALGVSPWTKGNPSLGTCVMQAHWITKKGRTKNTVIFRDGRDVMVSFYFHSFFTNEFSNEKIVNYMRSLCQFKNYEDIESNILPFMKIMNSNPMSPRFTWSDFVDKWAGKDDIAYVRYENLRLNTSEELSKLYQILTGKLLDANRAETIANKYSINEMRKNRQLLYPNMSINTSPQVSFMRKGSVGGWKDIFNLEATRYFDDTCGEAQLKIDRYL